MDGVKKQPTTSWGGIAYTKADYMDKMKQLTDSQVYNEWMAYAIAEDEATIEYFLDNVEPFDYSCEEEECYYNDVPRDMAYDDMVEAIKAVYEQGKSIPSLEAVEQLWHKAFSVSGISFLPPYQFRDMEDDFSYYLNRSVKLSDWG